MTYYRDLIPACRQATHWGEDEGEPHGGYNGYETPLVDLENALTLFDTLED